MPPPPTNHFPPSTNYPNNRERRSDGKLKDREIREREAAAAEYKRKRNFNDFVSVSFYFSRVIIIIFFFSSVAVEIFSNLIVLSDEIHHHHTHHEETMHTAHVPRLPMTIRHHHRGAGLHLYLLTTDRAIVLILLIQTDILIDHFTLLFLQNERPTVRTTLSHPQTLMQAAQQAYQIKPGSIPELSVLFQTVLLKNIIHQSRPFQGQLQVFPTDTWTRATTIDGLLENSTVDDALFRMNDENCHHSLPLLREVALTTCAHIGQIEIDYGK